MQMNSINTSIIKYVFEQFVNRLNTYVDKNVVIPPFKIINYHSSMPYHLTTFADSIDYFYRNSVSNQIVLDVSKPDEVEGYKDTIKSLLHIKDNYEIDDICSYLEKFVINNEFTNPASEIYDVKSRKYYFFEKIIHENLKLALELHKNIFVHGVKTPLTSENYNALLNILFSLTKILDDKEAMIHVYYFLEQDSLYEVGNPIIDKLLDVITDANAEGYVLGDTFL